MTSVSRRGVLIGGAVAGAGLVLGISYLRSTPAAAAPVQIDAWLRIAPDGKIAVRTISADMGQGAQTGIAQIVAEELDAEWSDVSVEMAPVEDAFFIRDGGYYTGGSQSIVESIERFRETGAAARAMLMTAAAQQWNVGVDTCRTDRGRVLHDASGRSVSYGELAEAASHLPRPATVTLKPREQWRIVGQALPRLDLEEKVDGSAIYGVDVHVENMLIGTIAQCPVRGGKLLRVDEAPALAIAGVRQVVALDNAVVVLADGFWTARRGLEALSPEWDFGAAAAVDSAALFAGLEANVGAADSTLYVPDGGDEAAMRKANADAFAAASRTIEAVYRAPFLSHSPIEPMNATARVDASGAEIWAPTQDAGDTRKDVAEALGLQPAQVRVHTTRIGGGFGRRLRVDYAVFAARTAQRAGRPVKLIWTREEDTQHGFYRPASVMRLRAALDATNAVTALETFGATNNDTAFGGTALMRYGIPSVIAGQKETPSHIPYGPWRAVDRTQNTFFLESFIDEIAQATGQDPLAFRRALLKDHPRHLRVLDNVAEMAGWGSPKPGRHLGLAFMSGWGTGVAQIAEISVDAANRLRVHRISCAFDCGSMINPGMVRAQVEGGILMGVSAALAEQITLKDGRVEQALFDSYPLLRYGAAPEIDVRLLESPEEPMAGVGEPPLPPAAPAICNAIFAATGRRLRSLPIVTHGFTVA